MFPPFLTLIPGGSKHLVGFVQTAQGVTALVAAPLCGVAMDAMGEGRCGGTRSMRWLAAAVGLGALGIVGYAISTEATGPVMYAAVGAWGLLLSAQGVLVETTLANSVRKGTERTWAYVTKATWWRMGNAVAQGANLVVFYATGNKWEVGVLKCVMYAGLAVLVLPVLLLLTLRSVGGDDDGGTDNVARGAEGEGGGEGKEEVRGWEGGGGGGEGREGGAGGGGGGGSDGVARAMATTTSMTATATVTTALLAGNGSTPSSSSSSASSASSLSSSAPPPAGLPRCLRCCRPQWVIAFAVLLRVVGKGVVMRFNPILFQDKYNLSPATLTWLVLAAQILSVFSPMLCNAIATCIGRAKTMVFVRLLEPACLLGMVFNGNNVYVAGGCFIVLLGIPIGTRAIEKVRGDGENEENGVV